MAGVTVAAETGNVFPVAVLDGCETALVLFAAAFGGAQDAAFVRDAGLQATCVDTNRAALERMQRHYPDDWVFVCEDAFVFPRLTQRTWDVVTADVFTTDFDRAAATVGMWCGLANRAVVLGTGRGVRVAAPDGWEVTGRVRRSNFNGGVFWAVLEQTSQ